MCFRLPLRINRGSLKNECKGGAAWLRTQLETFALSQRQPETQNRLMFC